MQPTSRSSITLALLVVLTGCASQDEPTGPWSLAGQDVTFEEINSSAGPSHCAWEEAHFLSVAWPPGSGASSGTENRTYIRDPNGVLPRRELRERLRLDAELPPEALATGYENDGWELWFASSDDSTAAYLVRNGGDTIESWPRDTTGLGCD